ncbi:MAG: winged helix-turn-helix transcriptional regulator [Alphaproteobacteria bacterium]|nr:winged helix-turn-helix transcriptional regulator [Alphaproteobacteria bacterium]
METTRYLIVPLLQAFCWFDDGLQAFLQKRGWAHVTRPQSMVMVNVLTGVRRPSEIARNVGVSRQAMHTTIGQMIEMGMLEMRDDPADKRSKIVALSAKGHTMRKDADMAVEALTGELIRRIGKENVANLSKAFAADWGAPLADIVVPAAAVREDRPRPKRSAAK